MTLSRRFNRDVNNIAEGCISNIITGYYDLYVYDVENDHKLSDLPAIIKNQVFVNEQTTTTATSTITITTTTTAVASSSLILSTGTTGLPTVPPTDIADTVLASSSLILSPSRPSTS